MGRFVFVSLLVVSAAAWAQSESGDSDDKGNLNVTDKGGAEGSYKGVAPGAQALPPHPPKLPLQEGAAADDVARVPGAKTACRRCSWK